tara:strand:- start:398 stop:1702 length:1305 start_codon:yes stop_codon:yes gene_type:complete
MLMSSNLILYFIRHLAVLFAGILIGSFLGVPLLGGLAALLAMLTWHILNIIRFENWLATGQIENFPAGDGLWARIFSRANYNRNQSKSRRRQYRKLLKEIMTSTRAFPDGVVILNFNYEIINFNDAARDLIGFRKTFDRNQRIDNLIRHPDFVSYLNNSSNQSSIEISSPQKNDVWLSIRLIPYGVDQYLLLIRDITQRVRFELTRTDFIENASHELRTPLTVISGYMDTLIDDQSFPKMWSEPISDINEQVHRMNDLVDKLLALSKVENSVSAPLDKMIDLKPILIGSKKQGLALKDCPINIEVKLKSDVMLFGDEVEIQSVVSNLISNAVRYTACEGNIVINWWVDDSGGHLSVKDSGIGIAKDNIPRLTERFFRTDEGRARFKGGAGLGLAIVKHILVRHDATLEIVSQLNEGSLFICHFAPHRLSSYSHK